MTCNWLPGANEKFVSHPWKNVGQFLLFVRKKQIVEHQYYTSKRSKKMAKVGVNM